MFITDLIDGRVVEENGPTECPGDTLRHKRAPNIRHAETAIRRQIQQRKGLLEPSGILAIEWTDGLIRQGDRISFQKFDG